MCIRDSRNGVVGTVNGGVGLDLHTYSQFRLDSYLNGKYEKEACPKVPYPLPRIDQIMDSATGCETLSFLDAYSGYHQIRMKV